MYVGVVLGMGVWFTSVTFVNLYNFICLHQGLEGSPSHRFEEVVKLFQKVVRETMWELL